MLQRAAAIPRSCRRNFTCFEWRGPIEGPKEGGKDRCGRQPPRAALGLSGETRVHLQPRQSGGATFKNKYVPSSLKRSCLRLVCMVPPTNSVSQIDPPSPPPVALFLIHSLQRNYDLSGFRRSISISRSVISEGRSHFTSPPARSLPPSRSTRSRRFAMMPTLPSSVSRFPNLAPESSILIPSSVVALLLPG